MLSFACHRSVFPWHLFSNSGVACEERFSSFLLSAHVRFHVIPPMSLPGMDEWTKPTCTFFSGCYAGIALKRGLFLEISIVLLWWSCPCVTPWALLLCVRVPREPQECGVCWPSVHNEKKDGTAAWGAGAPGAAATCMTTRVLSVTPGFHSAVMVFNTRLHSQNSLISFERGNEILTTFLLLFNILKCLVFCCCCWLTAWVDYWRDFGPPQSIESRLKLILPEDLGPFLMDGVVLCHLANHLHPCSVAGIHVPSPAAVGLLLSVLAMNPPPGFHFYRPSLFPAQTWHGQVSAKCRELPGGLPENGGTRGKTAIGPIISVLSQFVFSVNWGPFSCLLSPLIFTTVNN